MLGLSIHGKGNFEYGLRIASKPLIGTSRILRLSRESQNEEQRSISCFFAFFAGSRSLSCHVNFHYSRVERYGRVVGLLEDIDTNDKILGIVGDTKGAFSDKSPQWLSDLTHMED